MVYHTLITVTVKSYNDPVSSYVAPSNSLAKGVAYTPSIFSGGIGPNHVSSQVIYTVNVATCLATTYMTIVYDNSVWLW